MPTRTVTVPAAGYVVGSKAILSLLVGIFEGKVPFWKAPPGDPRAPLRVLLSLELVEQWRYQRARERAGERITVPQLAEQFRLKQEVAYHLIRTGLLESERARVDFREETLITLSNVSAFFERYTFLAPRIPGLSSTQARDYLASLGIRAVAGPTIDGCRQYVYERSAEFDATISRFIAEKLANRARIAERRAARCARAEARRGVPSTRRF